MPKVKMRVIRPRRVNYEAVIEKEITDAAEKSKQDIIAAYEEYQQDFRDENKATVKGRKYIKADETRITVTYSGGTLGYIDKGTKPRIITAKNAPYLVFRTGYQPLTLPGAGPFGGGSSGLTRRVIGGPRGATGGWVKVKQVHHKGIRARNVTKTFAKTWETEWPRRMDAAVKRGKRKAEKAAGTRR